MTYILGVRLFGAGEVPSDRARCVLPLYNAIQAAPARQSRYPSTLIDSEDRSRYSINMP